MAVASRMVCEDRAVFLVFLIQYPTSQGPPYECLFFYFFEDKPLTLNLEPSFQYLI